MAQFNCPNCGQPIQDGISVCPNCNANFAAKQAAAAPTTAPTYQPTGYPIPVQQPKKKIKWWMIAIAVVVLLLMMRACFGGDSSKNDSAVSKVSNSEKTDTSEMESSKNNLENKGILGDYEVEILSAKIAKDYEGNSAIVINYQFTNNSDDAANFMFALSDKAFQNGIELESAIIMDSKTYDSDEKMKDIKPGKTIKVQSAFVLNDKKNTVEIEVSELISFSDKKVVKTFELQ